MNAKAVAFTSAMEGWIASLGPGVRSVTVTRHATWTLVKITVMTDGCSRALAVDLDLDQAATEQRGRVWWRTMSSTKNGVLVVAAGPHHDALATDDEPTAKRSLPRLKPRLRRLVRRGGNQARILAMPDECPEHR